MRDTVWVTIPGHPDYQISNYGEVLNLRTDKLLKPYINSGYFRLRIDGIKYYVHKLMMLSFYPDEDSSGYITHIDGDRLNNCLWNLDYARNSNFKGRIVKCKYCMHREDCDNPRSDYDDFYCADGEFR